MNFEIVAPYAFFAIGAIGRVIVPYIQARLASDEPFSFDWKYMIGQVIGALVALVPLVAGEQFLSQVGSMAWLAALLYGWGAGDIGRAVQKAVN